MFSLQVRPTKLPPNFPNYLIIIHNATLHSHRYISRVISLFLVCNFLSNSNHVDFLEEQIKLTQLDPQSLSLVHRARRRSIKKRVDIVSAVPHLRDYGERGLLPSIGARRRLRRPEVSTRQRGHAVLRHRRQTSGRACTSADARCPPRLGSSRPHPPLGQLHESRDQRRR